MVGKIHGLWTEEQRLLLHLLNEDSSYDPDTRALLFNAVSAEHLRRCGVTRPFTAGMLSSQYSDRRRAERRHLWDPVIQPAATEAEKSKRDDIRKRILDASKQLGLDGTAAGTSPLSGTKSVNTHVSIAADGESGEEAAVDSEVSRYRVSKRELNALKDWRSNPKLKTQASKEQRESSNRPNLPILRPTPGDKAISVPGDSYTIQELSANTKRPAPALQTAKAGRLDMVHRNSLRWKGEQANLDFTEHAFLDETSDVYKRGGSALRVIVLDNQEVDYMVCDPAICPKCSPDPDKHTLASNLQGLPRLHASDTMRGNERTTFRPAGARGEFDGKGYLREVHFQTTESVISCVARVCDYVRCDTCSKSERERVEENARLNEREERPKRNIEG